MRSYEDEAQCGIYLSPSPLLKHYRRLNPSAHPRRHGHGPRQGEATGQAPQALGQTAGWLSCL